MKNKPVIFGAAAVLAGGIGYALFGMDSSKVERISADKSPNEAAQIAIKQFDKYEKSKGKTDSNEDVCVLGENLNYAYFGIYQDLTKEYMSLIASSEFKDMAKQVCNIDTTEFANMLHQESRHIQDELERNKMWTVEHGEFAPLSQIKSLLETGKVGCKDLISYTVNQIESAEVNSLIEACLDAGNKGIVAGGGARSSDRLEDYIKTNLEECKLLYKSHNRLKRTVCSTDAKQCMFENTKTLCSR